MKENDGKKEERQGKQSKNHENMKHILGLLLEGDIEISGTGYLC